jgi:hypothetical protein
VAYLKHAEALLADLGLDSQRFWGPQAPVVRAFLSEASNRLKHKVILKLAMAKSNYKSKYDDMSPELIRVVRQLASQQVLREGEQRQECPACGSSGVAQGDYEVDWGQDADAYFDPYDAYTGAVTFEADGFACTVCGLQLSSAAELKEANMSTEWVIVQGHTGDEIYDGDEEG